MASSLSTHKFSNYIDTSRYVRYILGPTTDIFAGVVEVILIEEGFKKAIKETLCDKNMLHLLSLTDDSDTDTIIQKLKVNGLFESELKEYAAKTTRDKLQDLGVYQKLKGEDKKKADDGQPLSTKDITFLFSIFEKVWKVQDHFWSLLRRVKNERNDVCHKKMQLTPEQLKKLINDFEKPLKELLEGVINLYPHQKASIDQLERIIHDGVRDINERIREPLDPSSSQDYHVFRAEQKTFGPQATEHIQDISKEEIESKLIKHSQSVLCEWLPLYSATDTSNIAVPLEIDMEGEFHGVAPRPGTNTIDQNFILKVKSPSGEEPTVIILSGEAGAGKTTMLSLITEHYCKRHNQDFEGLSTYSIVFYIEFRNSKFGTLDQYLQEVLMDVVSDYGIQSVKNAIYKKPILFLCDGFDEKNDKSSNVFKEILNISSAKLKVLVTTRPIHTKDLTTRVNKSRRSRVNLKICHLTKASVIECMKKVVILQFENDHIRRDETLLEMTDLYNSMSPELKDIVTIPLYAQLLTTLLLNEPQLKTSIRTVTKLFLLLRENEIKRLLDKCQGNLAEDDVLKFLMVFNIRALINYHQNKHEISSDDIDAFKECLIGNSCFDDVMSSFFRIKHSASATRREIYCYRHLTDQEFGAAFAIIQCISYFDMLPKTEASNLFRMNKVFVFIAGILSETPETMRKYVEDFVKILPLDDVFFSMRFLADVFTESHNNNDLIDAISQRLSGKKRWAVNNVRDLSGLKALFHRVKPHYIELSFQSHMDPDTVIDLIPMMEAAYLADVPIGLFINGSLFEENIAYSDKFLINKAQYIRSFEGHLNQMSLIPNNIERLTLRIHQQQLPSLNDVLPKLTNLSYLDLELNISDFSEQVRLSRETRGCIVIIIHLGEVVGGDTVAPKVASFINSLCPENRKKATDSVESSQEVKSFGTIHIMKTRFTRDGIQSFIDSLDVGKCKIFIYIPIDVTQKDKILLSFFAHQRDFKLVLRIGHHFGNVSLTSNPLFSKVTECLASLSTCHRRLYQEEIKFRGGHDEIGNVGTQWLQEDSR